MKAWMNSSCRHHLVLMKQIKSIRKRERNVNQSVIHLWFLIYELCNTTIVTEILKCESIPQLMLHETTAKRNLIPTKKEQKKKSWFSTHMEVRRKQQKVKNKNKFVWNEREKVHVLRSAKREKINPSMIRLECFSWIKIKNVFRRFYKDVGQSYSLP